MASIEERLNQLQRELRLTRKQRRFCEEKAKNPEGPDWEAARDAGCGTSQNAWAVAACNYMAMPKIKKFLAAIHVEAQERSESINKYDVKAAIMGSTEIQEQLTAIARMPIPNMADFADAIKQENGDSWRLRLAEALEQGKGTVVSELKFDANGFPVIKLRDVSQKRTALETLARMQGLMRDQVEHSGPGGGPIEVSRTVNLDELSDEELMVLRKLHEREPSGTDPKPS